MESGAALKIIIGLAKPLGVASLKKLKKLKPIEQFRIQQAIESAFAEVWESLDAFFISEKVEEYKRGLVAIACEAELKPFTDDVSTLLKGSLDGEKLFEQIRSHQPFPQEIREERLEQIYRMVFPLVASIVCRTPVIVEQIEEKSLTEILSRFDQLKDQVSNVSSGIAQLRQEPQRRADELYSRVLQQALKKVLLGVEVTGLYGDSPLKQAKEEMFVLPGILEQTDERAKNDAQLLEEAVQHRNAFLRSAARAIVRGAPGAGKSTWSRWLQVHSLREKGILTLYVKLRSWQEGSLPTVIQLVEELVGSNMASEISADSVAKWVKQGGIAIILDGFDEVAPVRRDLMLKSIQDLADYIDGGSCVVTSRPLHSDHLARLVPLWTSWIIQPFDKPRILDYIGRWYRHAPLKEGASREVDANILHSKLIRDPHVSPLTSNPLMLATLLMVHHNDGELPKGRSRLYARYIDGMLGIWDDRQEVHADLSGLDREQKKRILTSFAIALHLDDKDELGETETLNLIDRSIKSYGYKVDAQQVLDSLRERSGLVIGPGSYSFSHKSVGEYLVAHAICDGDRIFNGEKLDRFLLHSERSNDRWLNVIYFWIGQTSVVDVQTFIEALTKEDLPLLLGLLWDQMDRFQKDWLSVQVLSCLEIVDSLAWKNSGEFEWVVWSMGKSVSDEELKSSKGLIIPIRHVAERHLEINMIAQIFQQIDIGMNSLPNYEKLACHNLAFAAALQFIDDYPERMRVISENTRWPDWQKKAHLSLNAFRYAKLSSIEEALQCWTHYSSDNEGVAEAWLAAAWLTDVGFRREQKKTCDSLTTLSAILARQWSNKALVLSLKYYNVNVLDDQVNKDTEFSDLLMIIQSQLDILVKKENVEIIDLAKSASSSLANLFQRRILVLG